MSDTNHETKRRWIRRLVIVIVGGVAVVGAAVAAAMSAIDFLVDLWWFDALNYGFYFWQRLFYRYVVFGGVAFFFFLIFFLNFWFAARFLKTAPAKGDLFDAAREKSRQQRLFKAFQTGSIWFYAPLSMVLGILIAIPLYQRWETFLFYLMGSESGVVDPYFGRDVAFYLFSYPIYTLVQRRLLLTLAILTATMLILYSAKNRLLQRPMFDFRRGARWHMSLLVLLLFGLGIWEFMLQRYGLLYVTSHSDIFYGPGYVEMNVVLPLIWGCIVMLTATAAVTVLLIQGRRMHKSGMVVAAIFLAVLALRYTGLLPRLVETYVVKPNEIQIESPYMSRHIEATLSAYKLTDLQIRDFDYERFPSVTGSPHIGDILRNIPVWNAETLVDVFQQLQELRTYYIFPQVSVGRYDVDGSQQQVFLSPREIEFGNLPGGARNWINEHLTYTHGFGAVMTPASQVGGQPMEWYLYDIPPRSPHDLVPEEPRIYYGLRSDYYSIVPNLAGEMNYPAGDSNILADYDGSGGVPISSLFRKFLFSYYMKNKTIFFSTKITDDSKLLFRRSILDRIQHLAPFLRLDGTPYLAVTKKGLFWIVDAYTSSRTYPASAPRSLGAFSFNYIRNSVKIVVDAYNGSVDFYIYDETDPIAAAYGRIYPGLFKTKDEMPADLQPHVRYPIDFFDIQMQIYANYHQGDPHVFYQQEDLWSFPKSTGQDNTVPLRPYYVTLDLIESPLINFILLQPMFPKGRDNLRAMAIAGCDPKNYGKLIIYNFPKGELVYGPSQIDALINQDPDISEQFTLWDQSGSQVVRGKMIILPVANSVLFIQPVYIKADSRVKIPELQRVIMSEGEVVVMEKSVQSAFAELRRRIALERKREGAVLKSPSASQQIPNLNLDSVFGAL